MGSETWTTPSTIAFGVAIPTTWPNEIRDNLKVHQKGGGQSSIETCVSAECLVLYNDTDSTFFVSGSNDVKYISTEHRESANKIELISQSSGSLTFFHNESSPPSGFAPLWIFNNSIVTPDFCDIILRIGMCLTCIYDSVNGLWYCKL